MANARAEAARIVEAARAEADRLDVDADAKRRSVQRDFELTMNERRTNLTRAMAELEATSKAEATRRLNDASDESRRMVEAATAQSERRIAHAKELAEELRMLRGRVLSQLIGIRGQLDSVPAMLASVNREGELLDSPTAAPELDAGELEPRELEAHRNSKLSDPRAGTLPNSRPHGSRSRPRPGAARTPRPRPR